MKKFLNTSILLLVIHTLLTGQAMASTRIDDLITADKEIQINKLSQKLHNLQSTKNDVENLEQHLKRTRKGQNIYLKLETMAGALIVVGVVIGSYKFYFPPGFRAMASAYVTATALSHGLIKLSDKEVSDFLAKITLLKMDIRKLEDSMTEQRNTACSELQYYILCEY